MEQLVWSVIIIAFIIYTALKNRTRNRPDTKRDKTSGVEHKAGGEDDKLGRYMEELLGIDREETKPQIRRERKTPKPLHKKVTPRVKAEIEKDVDQFESPLAKKHSEKRTSPLPEKKGSYYAKFPWSGLSKQDLSNAIILSEIIGPPISKRKSHRLF